VFLYDFATKTAQKPDTVATYIRRNEKIFKNHVERREKQLWLDEKAVKILLKKYPEVQRKKYPWWKNETEFEQAMIDQKEPQKEDNGLISLEKLFGEDEDTQVNKLKRQVKEQGEKIELLEREISVLQNEKKSFFGFKRR
jgi:hypothetical protein